MHWTVQIKVCIGVEFETGHCSITGMSSSCLYLRILRTIILLYISEWLLLFQHHVVVKLSTLQGTSDCLVILPDHFWTLYFVSGKSLYHTTKEQDFNSQSFHSTKVLTVQIALSQFQPRSWIICSVVNANRRTKLKWSLMKRILLLKF